MNFKRFETTCSVFEGKIVVTGGGCGKYMKSVEAYDHHENKWIIIPSMIKSRKIHNSVVVGNKLFVTGGYGRICSEVYDSISRKFTMFSFKLPCDPDRIRRDTDI